MVSNERAMLISRQIRAGMCRWEHKVETQSQVPSITQRQNKRGMDAFEYFALPAGIKTIQF